MKSLSFGNFQVGIVDNPSIEDKGGFDFASGMDIFSEPGVLKASVKMVETSYNGAGSQPTALPTEMVDTDDGTDTRAYIIAGAKILEATGETSWSLFRTNGQGNNLGIQIFNGYVHYASASKLGRVQVGNAGTANDSYATLETDAQYHPMITQGGTLKIGNGRYVGSLDEAGSLTNQANKLPVGYRVMTLAEYFGKVFSGTRRGTLTSAITIHDATVFDWRGTVLATGSALPDTAYPIRMLGMRSLFSDGHKLFGFPDKSLVIMVYDGANFAEYRNLKRLGVSLNVHHGSVHQQTDNSVLFAGESSLPGVWQMKGGAICQAYVPSSATPGATAEYDIGLVRSSFGGKIIIGFQKVSDNSFHIEHSHPSQHKQNNAMVRTLWHRFGTDKLKRHAGIKLNMKPLAPDCSVAVDYRTSRDAAFTSTGVTISSTNQNKPILFSAQPRSREIQYRFTYTTSNENTPELLTYDPIFEVLSSNR